MKRRLLGNLHWPLGILTAAAGVLAARLTGNHPADPSGAAIHIAGLLIAGAGLFVIAFGVGWRSGRTRE